MATNAILAPGWYNRFKTVIPAALKKSIHFNGSNADADNLGQELADEIKEAEEAEDADSDLDSDGG